MPGRSQILKLYRSCLFELKSHEELKKGVLEVRLTSFLKYLKNIYEHNIVSYDIQYCPCMTPDCFK